jgi:hypothetical protein
LATVSASEFHEALKHFDANADKSASAIDCDYGVMLLEYFADRCGDRDRRKQLYDAAENRAWQFMSYATSGAEALGRKVDVDRIISKLERLAINTDQTND